MIKMAYYKVGHLIEVLPDPGGPEHRCHAAQLLSSSNKSALLFSCSCWYTFFHIVIRSMAQSKLAVRVTSLVVRFIFANLMPAMILSHLVMVPDTPTPAFLATSK